MQDHLSSLVLSLLMPYLPHSASFTNSTISMANDLPSKKACNDFANFFTEKIQGIIKAVCTSASTPVPMLLPVRVNSVKMSQFCRINCKPLEEIVQQLISSFYYLDVLPTGFIKKVLPV